MKRAGTILLLLFGLLGVVLLVCGCSSADGSSNTDRTDPGDTYTGGYRIKSFTLMDSEYTLDRTDDTVHMGEFIFPTNESSIGQFDVEIQMDHSDPADGDFGDPGEQWVETFVSETSQWIANVVTYEKRQDDGLYDDKTINTFFTNGDYGYVNRTTQFDTDLDGQMGDDDGDDDTVYRVRTYAAGKVTKEEFYFNPYNAETNVENYRKFREDTYSYDTEGRLSGMATWIDTDGDETVDRQYQEQAYTYENGRLTEIYTECDRDGDGSLESTGTSHYEYNALGLIEYGYFDWGEAEGEPHTAGYFEWEEGDCSVRGEDVLMSINTAGFFCLSNSMGGSSSPEGGGAAE